MDLARLVEQEEAHLRVVSDADLAPLNPDSSKYDLKCWNRLLFHIRESHPEAKRWHREFHNVSAVRRFPIGDSTMHLLASLGARGRGSGTSRIPSVPEMDVR